MMIFLFLLLYFLRDNTRLIDQLQSVFDTLFSYSRLRIAKLEEQITSDMKWNQRLMTFIPRTPKGFHIITDGSCETLICCCCIIPCDLDPSKAEVDIPTTKQCSRIEIMISVFFCHTYRFIQITNCLPI